MAAKMTVYQIKYKKIFSETDKVIGAIESNILTITHANYVIPNNSHDGNEHLKHALTRFLLIHCTP